MGIKCWRNTLLLLTALVLATKLGHFQRWGGFQEKSMSKKNMNSSLKFFIENYNNVSNDMYLFQIDKLLQSHMQVCASVSLNMSSALIIAHLYMPRCVVVYRESQMIVSPSGVYLHLEWESFRVVQTSSLFSHLPKC